ncbi:MAG TPA: LytR C-terminal domain-containing protein [Mycobacteriales bacterium]|nr:LytR C-terminal domain-containing protein [Mycobacteriales bacterium]
MTIPGRGDLSPRRKHRNWRRRLTIAVVLLVVAGGGYAGYRGMSGGSSAPPKALPPCPAAVATPTSAQADRVVVRNATLKTGLAKEVTRELRQRSFRVGKPGNTLFRGKGVATVQYSADRLQSARLLSAQFAGASMTEVTGSRVLEVDIGPKFRALVPVAQAQAAERGILASSSPSPTATPSPTCGPRSVSPTRRVTP